MSKPFENYKAPAIDEIFSEAGKAQMLDLKLSRFRQSFTIAALEDGALDAFLDGEAIETEYDSINLRRLRYFERNEEEIILMSRYATKGIVDALLSQDKYKPSNFVAKFSTDEEARIVTVQVTVQNDTHEY